MTIGVGTDIVEIDRIKQALARHQERFVDRLLSLEEQLQWVALGSRVNSLAGAWAAKEAVAKALGTGFRDFGLKDIVITRDPLGKPSVTLLGGALAQASQQSIRAVLITISHSETYAIAFAVAE